MTVKECYEQMGADYEGVLGRLRSEALIKKFAKKFLDDGSYASLKKGMEEQNGEEAFRAAHTLKGVFQNLGFENLYEVTGWDTLNPIEVDAVQNSGHDLVLYTCTYEGKTRVTVFCDRKKETPIR